MGNPIIDDSKQKCPICCNVVDANPRYPNYVCWNCQTNYPPVTANGDRIEFGNIDASGGFKSIVNGVTGSESECYINGVKCSAGEARFGGIVIQPA